MRVLLVVDRMPWPLAQGMNLRVFNLARCLARDCAVDLVSYGEGAAPAEIQQVFRQVTLFPRPALPARRGLVGRLRGLLSLADLQGHSAGMQEHLDRVIASRAYDAIWSYTHVMPYFRPGQAVPVVADVIDDAVLQFWRDLRRFRSARAWLTSLRYLLLHLRFEHRYFAPRYVHSAFITSEIDAAVLRRICPDTRVEVIENGVDARYFAPQDCAEDAATIAFEGNMTHGPNAEGALYFCHEVLPLVRRSVPDARVVLVGKDPSPAVRALAAEPGIEVTGFVDDVRPYLARATVFVCPLLNGGGIKNKVLQAWAMGKACVATSFSTGGLQAADDVNMLIRDRPAEMASAIVELLRDPARRRRLGGNARAVIERHYSWESKAEQMHGLLRVAGGCHQSAGARA